MNVVEKLESIGVQVNPYKRGPAGKDSFAISVDGPRLRLWEGLAEVTVSTNKRKRQAVINVVEKPRKIKTSCHVSVRTNSDMNSVNSESTQEELASFVKVKGYDTAELRNATHIQVPSSRLRVLGYKFTTNSWGLPVVRVNLEFTTHTTSTSFLVGYDTDAERPFVSQLKTVVKNVDEAHKELLPKDVELKPNHQRQGEWFFNPVNEKLAKELNSRMDKAVFDRINDVRDRWDFNFTTHFCMHLVHNRKRYAIGIVRDSRKGRHKPLVLNQWHEVIRNNEVKVSQAMTQTWD